MTRALLDGVEAAAGLAVYGAAQVDSTGAASTRQALVAAGVPGLLAGKDPTLWGAAAEDEARVRLGWLDTFHTSRELLPQLAELRTELADLDRVVLCASGGPALAAEAICATVGRPLTVLDTTDPQRIRAALAGDLRHTAFVVSGTAQAPMETDSLLRTIRQALTGTGLDASEAGRHLVVVTDADTPLEQAGIEAGALVFRADPHVAGPYAALTAYGLVPAALAGVDVAELLDQAELLSPALADHTDNPGLALGAALAAAAIGGRDAIALASDGSGLEALGPWIEQLLASSTGKNGVGLLPVVVESPASPGVYGQDVLTVTYGGALTPAAVPGNGPVPDLAVNGPLGAQFLAWEYATAIVGRVLGVNPFDRPDVAAAERNAAALLAEGIPAEEPAFTEGAVQVWTHSGAGDLTGVLHDLITGIGYLAVVAYLDPVADARIARLRAVLADASGRPVTFGWGPRHLHGAGQYHHGGPAVGSLLQLTGAIIDDLAVPGTPYSFGALQAAQVAGDRRAWTDRGRPVVRLHLTDRAAGVGQLLDAAIKLRP